MTKPHQLDNYEVDQLYGCWLYLGSTGNAGYGVIWRGKTSKSFHVAMYELYVGKVPGGELVDHYCSRRRCGRPAHLQAVSARVNQLRRQWSVRCAIKRCPRDLHSMDDAIVVVGDRGVMGRVCRPCSRGDAP